MPNACKQRPNFISLVITILLWQKIQITYPHYLGISWINYLASSAILNKKTHIIMKILYRDKSSNSYIRSSVDLGIN